MTTALRIVVADDERDTREYLRDMLTRMGHTLTVTGTHGNDVFSFVANASRHSMALNGVNLAVRTVDRSTRHRRL